MPTDEAWDVSERLADEEGLLVGHSSGARSRARCASPSELRGRRKTGVVVTLLPDRADRYFEAPLVDADPASHRQESARRAHRAPPDAHARGAGRDVRPRRREYPKECCGIVYGAEAARRRQCRRLRQHQNELHADGSGDAQARRATAYNLGAADLFKLQKSLRGASRRRSSITRTSTCGAYFSATDQAAAHFDGEPSYPVEYLVIDVRIRRRQRRRPVLLGRRREEATSKSAATPAPRAEPLTPTLSPQAG